MLPGDTGHIIPDEAKRQMVSLMRPLRHPTIPDSDSARSTQTPPLFCAALYQTFIKTQQHIQRVLYQCGDIFIIGRLYPILIR
jgi:hypothetical protein